MIPAATYRLQFHRGFPLARAAELIEYLDALGVGACYASPLLRARPGSTHGYDVCDFNALNPELGSGSDLDAFCRALQDRGMGLLLDMVPNHMGIGDPANAWWMDLLENGTRSIHARTFDVDWDPGKPELRGKVLLPILEDDYRRVLESGKIRVVNERGTLLVAYHDHRLPLSPESRQGILRRVREAGSARSGGSPGAAALDGALREINGEGSSPGDFAALDALLEAQNYRLAWWRIGPEEINYRRFFDITDLAAVRVELPEVFERTHRLVLRWLGEGKVTGLRIDHPDGLWDPEGYFRRLQESFSARRGEGGGGGRPLYIVVEKILGPEEELPRHWAVSGTTGYEFLNDLNGLFVDSSNEAAFDALYGEFTGRRLGCSEVVHAAKLAVLRSSLRSEVNALRRRLEALAASRGRGREFTSGLLQEAVEEVIACFPIYRTYVREGLEAPAPGEAASIESALKDAARRAPRLPEAALRLIGDLLLLRSAGGGDAGRQQGLEWAMKFQQLTGPAMAKGVEDTAFYLYNRLASLNEVGGHPGRFGVAVEEFHRRSRRRNERWPHSLLATATHDTKRGEDVRARINVLSEIPEEWRAALARWGRMNEGLKCRGRGEPAPGRNDEYLLYQTLLGAWPPGLETAVELEAFRQRISAYLLKAAREAKDRTSWVDPDPDYERALGVFVQGLLGALDGNPFLEDFLPFQRRIAFFGRFNSLSQTLIKLASPGVPDIYQGTELWDQNLVDPDNRRPIDYSIRSRMLGEIRSGLETDPGRRRQWLRSLLEDGAGGREKLLVLHAALAFRRLNPDLFARGDYVPLAAAGEKKDHLIAFARFHRGRSALAAAPRLVHGLLGGRERPPLGPEVWKDTSIELPVELLGKRFQNLFTGESIASEEGGGRRRLPAALALKDFPVALLAGG